MEFLYKLYDMEYFPVALLIVIAILVFLFLLILFFGKKEEKERKLEETKKLELEKNGFKEVETGKEELKVPEIPQPVLEQVENVEQNVQTDAVIPTFESSIEEEINVEQSNDEVITPSFEIPVISETENIIEKDEEKLNSFVSDVENNEVEQQEENKSADTVLSEIDIDSLFETNIETAVTEEEVPDIEPISLEEPIFEEVEVSKVETPFSSVYTNNELSKKDNMAFELPKMADLPKLKEESNVEQANDFDSLFGDIEPETYSINK